MDAEAAFAIIGVAACLCILAGILYLTTYIIIEKIQARHRPKEKETWRAALERARNNEWNIDSHKRKNKSQ